MITKTLFALLFTATVASAQQTEDAFVGQKAPEFKTSHMWLNTAPLTLQQLRGKVVLIEFWAWDCPFCAEATPHMKELNDKYGKQGLVIIGVHTPRFEYEKDVTKLKEAIAKKEIQYPIVIDNDYEVWSDYLCAVWPSWFVLDRNGVIQLSHSGVGRYEETEKVIQKLLNENNGK